MDRIILRVLCEGAEGKECCFKRQPHGEKMVDVTDEPQVAPDRGQYQSPYSHAYLDVAHTPLPSSIVGFPVTSCLLLMSGQVEQDLNLDVHSSLRTDGRPPYDTMLAVMIAMITREFGHCCKPSASTCYTCSRSSLEALGKEEEGKEV